MKNSLLSFPIFILVILVTFDVQGQQENRCGLLDEESSCGLSYIDFSYSIDPSDLEIYDPVVFNVYYWDVRPHGFTDQVLELEEALASIAALNIAFNEYNIFLNFEVLRF